MQDEILKKIVANANLPLKDVSCLWLATDNYVHEVAQGIARSDVFMQVVNFLK